NSVNDFYNLSVVGYSGSHSTAIKYVRSTQTWKFFDPEFIEIEFTTKKDCRDFVVEHFKQHYGNFTAIMIDIFDRIDILHQPHLGNNKC
ncbi:MAG: hypothetical protein KIT27_00005, partial [Legionellales bacterium]|nr:hypothetical protein [Legionellales bacterium]